MRIATGEIEESVEPDDGKARQARTLQAPRGRNFKLRHYLRRRARLGRHPTAGAVPRAECAKRQSRQPRPCGTRSRGSGAETADAPLAYRSAAPRRDDAEAGSGPA